MQNPSSTLTRTLFAGLFYRRQGLIGTLVALAALHRSRRALATLPPSALEDIGVTTQEAACEARRPLWDVPQHWLS